MLTKVMDAEHERDTFIDTRVPRFVRILNGSLDEDPSSPSGIVLTGRIDPATLHFLRVDNSYQRPLGNRQDIHDALKAGTVVPSIDVGVRGQDFVTEGDDYLIRDQAFIIDGRQRVGTALQILENIPHHPMRIFAMVHFGTEEKWERHRFTELNKNVKKVSPNLHLRNMRDQNEAILTLFGLSNSVRDFPLFKKVSWGQNMKAGELMSALVLAQVSLRLHGHLSVRGAAQSAQFISAHLREATRKATLNAFRKNVTTFFDLIEECFGIRSIELRHGAPQLKRTFLLQVCRMLSDHLDFWDDTGRHLFVAADLRRKLAKFPLQDPHVRNLAGSAGAAVNILHDLLVSHMNSGRRTGHLRLREPGA